MNSFIILAAILGGGFLGLLVGVACMFNKERGNCEECSKGCAMNYFYIDGDCEIEEISGDSNVDITCKCACMCDNCGDDSEIDDDDEDDDSECCNYCINFCCNKRKKDSENNEQADSEQKEGIKEC